jgi:hypothetical protein
MIMLTGTLVLCLSGCTKYEIPTPPCPDGTHGLSYSADIQPIFNQSCTMCHSGSQVPDLSEGWSYDELMDGGYVDADFPCESILYTKFSDTHDGRASEEEVLMILGWIQDGAEDN